MYSKKVYKRSKVHGKWSHSQIVCILKSFFCNTVLSVLELIYNKIYVESNNNLKTFSVMKSMTLVACIEQIFVKDT